MENIDIIKLFLENKDVQRYINNNDWDHIYNSGDKYTSVDFLWDHPDMTDDIIGDFTTILLRRKINPLNYMKKVPEAFLREAHFNTDVGIDVFEIPRNIETIDGAAFYGCSGLKFITIPVSVRKIEQDAFSESSITDIYYTGKISTWEKIKIVQGAFSLLDNGEVKVHCRDGVKIIEED